MITINQFINKTNEITKMLNEIPREKYFIAFTTFGIIFIIMLILLLMAITRITHNYKSLLMLQENTNKRLAESVKKERIANSAKTEFLSKISHDIRTPINGIIGMSQIAKEKITDKTKVLDCLDKITTASEHLFNLINDVLDVSAIEKGKVNIRKAKVDLNELLDEILTIISYQANLKDQDVEVNNNIKNSFILADKIYLK